MKRQIMWSILLLTLLLGCQWVKNAVALEGAYFAKYSFGTDTLQLLKDGFYRQWISIDGDSVVYKTEGHWSFDSSTDYIRIENILILVDGFGRLKEDFRTPSSGVSFLPVSRKFLFGRIYFGSDELTPYLKSDNP